jgi:hypothetical protein
MMDERNRQRQGKKSNVIVACILVYIAESLKYVFLTVGESHDTALDDVHR